MLKQLMQEVTALHRLSEKGIPDDCKYCSPYSYRGKYTAMAGTQTANDRSVPLHSCAGPSVRAILIKPSHAFLWTSSKS